MKNNQKSIADYRQLIKLLKLKLIRLQQQFTTIKQNKNQIPNINTNIVIPKPDPNLLSKINQLRSAQSLQNKIDLLKCTQKLATQMGYNLQYIFRRADIKYEGNCETKNLVHFLRSILKVNNPVQIAHIFDQQGRGYINYNHFILILNCYTVAAKPNIDVIIELVKDLAYKLRLSQQLPSQLQLFQIQVKNQSLNKIMDYQVLALHSYLIDKGQFLKQKIDQLKTWQLNVTTNSQQQQNILFTARQMLLIDKLFQSQLQQLKPQQGAKIINALSQKGLQLIDLVKSMLSTKNYEKQVNFVFTLNKLHKIIKFHYPFLSRSQIILIFSLLDTSKAGSFDISEILQFYLNYKTQDHSLLIAVQLLATLICSAKLTPQSFLSLCGLGQNGIILWQDFKYFIQFFLDYDVQILKPMFNYMHSRSALRKRNQPIPQNPSILKVQFIKKFRRVCPYFEQAPHQLYTDFVTYLNEHVKAKSQAFNDLVNDVTKKQILSGRSQKKTQKSQFSEISSPRKSLQINNVTSQKETISKQQIKEQEVLEFNPDELQFQ